MVAGGIVASGMVATWLVTGGNRSVVTALGKVGLCRPSRRKSWSKLNRCMGTSRANVVT